MRIKIFLLGFIFVLLFKFSPSPVFAQSPTSSPSATLQTDPKLHVYTQNVMIEVASGLSCLIGGIDAVNPQNKCLGIDPENKTIGYVDSNGGAIGAMGNLIGMTFNIPVSSSDYVAYLSSNFGLAKPAYAQVDGFTGLRPVIKIWVGFRNVVYLVFVLVFVFIGLGIMFRLQIDPRTVMTVQNQIPKITIGILLVTFSYAIAGFLIDLMWIFTFLSTKIIADTSPVNNSAAISQTLQNNLYEPPPGFANEMLPATYLGPLNVGGVLGIVARSGESVKVIIEQLFAPKDFSNIFAPGPMGAPACNGILDVGCWFGSHFSAAVGGLMSQFVGWLIAWVGKVLAWLIILIAVLSALFRLWFQLIKCYIFIFLDVIFAPFWILGGILPGNQTTGFSAWLRDMVGNLAVFPVTIIMFVLARVFIEGFNATAVNDTFIPPLIGKPGATSFSIAPLIALGIVLITPEVVTMVRDAIKAPKIPYGSAIGQSFGAGGAAFGAATGYGWNRMWRKSAPMYGIMKEGPARTWARNVLPGKLKGLIEEGPKP